MQGITTKTTSYLIRPSKLGGVLVADTRGEVTFHASPENALLNILQAGKRATKRGADAVIAEVTWEGFADGFVPPQI